VHFAVHEPNALLAPRADVIQIQRPINISDVVHDRPQVSLAEHVIELEVHVLVDENRIAIKLSESSRNSFFVFDRDGCIGEADGANPYQPHIHL
jgi:hypothetical protein